MIACGPVRPGPFAVGDGEQHIDRKHGREELSYGRSGGSMA